MNAMPASLDLESVVLGTMILQPHLAQEIVGQVAEHDFSVVPNRIVYNAIREMVAAQIGIDPATVADYLGKKNQLAEIGGPKRILKLLEGLPEYPSVAGQCDVLREYGARRRLVLIGQAAQGYALDRSASPAEIVGRISSELEAINDHAAGSDEAITPSAYIDAVGGIDAAIAPVTEGVRSGFYDLDRMTWGFRPGELIIIAARSSFGKTALGLSIAEYVALKENKSIALFTLEMDVQQMFQRFVCAHARVDQLRLRMGQLNSDERRKLTAAAEELRRAKIYIVDRTSISVDAALAQCRRIQSRHGLDLVIFDYLQLAASGQKRSENRTQEVSAVSRSLKVSAGELGVPVIALSQLSRAPEQRTGDHRPMLSDLRESGSIEQDASVVMFIYREEKYKPDREDLKGIAEIIIAKQRNGPTGTVRLAFRDKYARFDNLADSEAPISGDEPWEDAAA